MAAMSIPAFHVSDLSKAEGGGDVCIASHQSGGFAAVALSADDGLGGLQCYNVPDLVSTKS